MIVHKGYLGAGTQPPSASMGGPYISVIVTAWNRREYLAQALTSLTHQTLDPSQFEVVVVKNFHDEHADKIIEKQGYTDIQCDDSRISYKYVLGLKHCSGEVVCFLDDDDLFHPTKLEEVKNMFERIDDLGYLRNSLKVFTQSPNIGPRHAIAGDGVPPAPYGPGSIDAAPPPKGDIEQDTLIRKPRSQKLDKVNLVYRFHANSSSVSIRRNILERYLDALKQIESAVDVFFFAAGYMADSAMMFSSKTLTYVRLHPQQTSVDWIYSGLDGFLKKTGARVRRWAHDYCLMGRMCAGTDLERVFELGQNDYGLMADIYTGSRSRVALSLAKMVWGEVSAIRTFPSRWRRYLWLFFSPSSSLYGGLLVIMLQPYARRLYYLRLQNYFAGQYLSMEATPRGRLGSRDSRA